MRDSLWNKKNVIMGRAKITKKDLEKISQYYHHSAYTRKEDFNESEDYDIEAYAGRFGIGIKVWVPKSNEYQYYIFK